MILGFLLSGIFLLQEAYALLRKLSVQYDYRVRNSTNLLLVVILRVFVGIS